MRIETGGRQTGRTTKMIEWLKGNPYSVLVVANEGEARRLRDLYDSDGIMGIQYRIVGARAQLNRRPSFHSPQIAIDDADLILRDLFGDVKVITVLTPEVSE